MPNQALEDLEVVELGSGSFSVLEYGKLVKGDRVHVAAVKTNDKQFMLTLEERGTHFGIVIGRDGDTADEIESALLSYRVGKVPVGIVLRPNMVFCIPGHGAVVTRTTNVVIVSRDGWLGLPHFAGPLEEMGRLTGVYGTSESVLVPAIRIDDPSLNLLHFPPGTEQPPHAHPATRVGVVLSGRGRCRYVASADSPDYAEVELEPGMVYITRANGTHAFSTPHGEAMRVVEYHDSVVGPRE